jgi:nitric oxide reductase subunit C
MTKIVIACSLLGFYLLYSFMVYTKGTEQGIAFPAREQAAINKGKILFQQHNCIACHQLYGLGGYLGPELTSAYSDPQRGELYMQVFLQAGGERMPKFGFRQAEIDELISYLKYVDATAVTYKGGNK